MRKISPLLVALGLFSAVALGPAAADASTHPASVPSPVVIERFATLHPRVGQREVVYVQALDHDKPVAGAQMSATVQLGKRTLARVNGTRTDRKGQAQAAFKIPAVARGKTLRVYVTLLYRGYRFPGRNDLQVQG